MEVAQTRLINEDCSKRAEAEEDQRQYDGTQRMFGREGGGRHCEVTGFVYRLSDSFSLSLRTAPSPSVKYALSRFAPLGIARLCGIRHVRSDGAFRNGTHPRSGVSAIHPWQRGIVATWR